MGKRKQLDEEVLPWQTLVRPLGAQEAETIQQLIRSRTVPAGLYQRALMIYWSSQGQRLN